MIMSSRVSARGDSVVKNAITYNIQIQNIIISKYNFPKCKCVCLHSASLHSYFSNISFILCRKNKQQIRRNFLNTQQNSAVIFQTAFFLSLLIRNITLRQLQRETILICIFPKWLWFKCCRHMWPKIKHTHFCMLPHYHHVCFVQRLAFTKELILLDFASFFTEE